MAMNLFADISPEQTASTALLARNRSSNPGAGYEGCKQATFRCSSLTLAFSFTEQIFSLLNMEFVYLSPECTT
jgi:hypothetical protein